MALNQIIARLEALMRSDVQTYAEAARRPSRNSRNTGRILRPVIVINMSQKRDDPTKAVRELIESEIPVLDRPRIVIHDVDKRIIKTKLVQYFYKFGNFKYDYFRIDTALTPIYQTGPTHGQFVSWVFSVEQWLFLELLQRGRLLSSHKSHRVEAYAGLQRCFRCQSFGHKHQNCSSETGVCKHCAGSHSVKNCTLRGSPRCANCKKVGLTFKHKVWDEKCPYYLAAIKKAFPPIQFSVLSED